MATSTIPVAIAALVALAKANVTGVDVHDGPPVSGESPDYICIGFDPVDPLTAVEGGQVPASLGNRAREESYEILGSLASASGDESMADRRVRAMAMFADLEAALRTDVTLGGVVRSAQVASYSLVQEQTDKGPSAGLRFRIACSARLTT